jgi:hypothetical protein
LERAVLFLPGCIDKTASAMISMEVGDDHVSNITGLYPHSASPVVSPHLRADRHAEKLLILLVTHPASQE